MNRFFSRSNSGWVTVGRCVGEVSQRRWMRTVGLLLHVLHELGRWVGIIRSCLRWCMN